MNDFKISVTPLSEYDLDDLKVIWQELYTRSKPNVFLSWNWIGSWLSILSPQQDAIVVEAKRHELVVGLSIFCRTQIFRRGFIKSSQWHLHRTGNSELDQMWIEHNGILSAEGHESEIRSAVIQHLTQSFDFDELSIGMASSELAAEASQATHLYWFDSFPQLAYRKNLKKQNPLSKSLSRQITKTNEIISSLGSLTWLITSSPQEIQEVLSQGKHWHQEKWRHTSTPSGFDNPNFTRFHECLINQNNIPNNDQNKVVLIALYLDGDLIGFNYLLIDKISVYFYLSSLQTFDDNRIKLGFLIHEKSIQWAASQGYQYYDFIAGDSFYKRRFSDEKYCLFDNMLQKKKLSFFTERMLSKIKRKLVRS